MRASQAYLNRVVDLVREVLDRANRSLLLRRVLRGGVRLRQVRHDNLRVTLGAEGTRLEKWLQVEDTTLVHVHTRLDVVQRVCNAVNAVEEFLVVDV